MRKTPDLALVCAVVVPMVLGFGLLYLSIIGGMGSAAVFLALLGLALLVTLAAALVQAARQDGRSSRNGRRRRRKRTAPAPSAGSGIPGSLR